MIILRNPNTLPHQSYELLTFNTNHQTSISTKIKDMENQKLMKLLNVLFFVPFDKYSYINTSYVQFFSSASCWPWSPQSPKLPALPKDWDPKTSCLSPPTQAWWISSGLISWDIRRKVSDAWTMKQMILETNGVMDLHDDHPGISRWNTIVKDSGQIILFHQPRFAWNKGMSLSQLHFGVRSCEVARIWPKDWFKWFSCANRRLFQVPAVNFLGSNQGLDPSKNEGEWLGSVF